MKERRVKKFAIFLRLVAELFFILPIFMAGPVYAGTCTSPAGKEGDFFYNGDFHTYQFCNGTSWIAYGGGGTCAGSGNYSPTTPSRAGYLVLSYGTHNGNLGLQSGADATCLTDITTHTGWMGYSTANSNGQLVADKVHAFLCEGSYSPCNISLMPLTTYYFANAANSAAGGASITTDLNGIGPLDNANWGAANYFSGTYMFWSDRFVTDSAHWQDIAWQSANCADWSDGTSGSTAFIGISTETDSARWGDQSYIPCNQTFHLLCVVDP